MIFLEALLVFSIDAFDITLITCEVQWLNKNELEQIMSAEISELAEEERRGMILVVDQCSDESLRLRVSNHSGQRERVVSTKDIPEEALLRTVALALSDLCRESDSAKNPSHNAQTRDSETQKNATTKNKTQKDIAKERQDERAILTAMQEEYRISVGAYLRWFPLAETFAPEIRFGLRKHPWRIELGGYAMGWDDEIGKTYLVAITSTAGPTLWSYRGAISIGLDVLAELGAVTAFGEANDNSDETTRFNIAAGGHLAFWMDFGKAEGFQSLLNLEIGWLRGLNMFVDDAFRAGFEGLSTRFGLVAVW